MEIVNFKSLKLGRLVHGLKQPVTQIGIGPHGAAAVH